MRLCKQGRYDVNYRDGAGRTPLHNACVRGHVRMLISEFRVYEYLGCCTQLRHTHSSLEACHKRLSNWKTLLSIKVTSSSMPTNHTKN